MMVAPMGNNEEDGQGSERAADEEREEWDGSPEPLDEEEERIFQESLKKHRSLYEKLSKL